MIEHVLAVRMPLAVRRQQRTHLPVTLQHQVFRRPAGGWRNTAAVLQSAQERMAQEGLAGRYQGVPGRGRQVTQMGKAVEAGHDVDSRSEGISIREYRPFTQIPNAGPILSFSIT
ncbi:hypothetical protein D3C73_962850 [compost metagenome]